jgi:hypothetical protein
LARRVAPDLVIGLDHSALQEAIMNQLIRAGAITLAIFCSVGIAVAQRAPGYDHQDLTTAQQRTVSQGLASSPSQTVPTGAQPQVGDKVPDSMTAQSMPSDVSNQVPEAKSLLFVKLPDRLLLIDPDTKMVSEIVMDSNSDSTTGSNQNPSNPGNASDQPSNQQSK